MVGKRRNGVRKDRSERMGKKPELGYYVIVVNTKDTERLFFHGLRDSLSPELRRKLSIVVFKSKTGNMIEECKKRIEYDPQNRKGWIIFDRDQELDFDKLIVDAKKESIGVGWSSPCFEIWLYAYYGEMPVMQNAKPESASKECCKRFGEVYEKRNKVKYLKSDSNLYSNLIQTGDEERAIEIARDRFKRCLSDFKDKKPSEFDSCTSVFKLVSEIKEKVLKTEKQ